MTVKSTCYDNIGQPEKWRTDTGQRGADKDTP